MGKKNNYIFISILILTFVFGSTVLAQDVRLESLIEEALQNNAQVKAAQNEWKAAKAKIPQASALPDPMAEYSFMGEMLETPLGPQEEMYEFEQEIPFPGKLIEKRKMAKAELTAAQAKVKWVEQDTILKITETYYELFAMNHSLEILEKIKTALSKFESIEQARYASSEGSQKDVVKMQSEVTDVIKEIILLNQQKETLMAYLNTLLNRPIDFLIEEFNEPKFPKEIISYEELLQLAKQHNPMLNEAQAMNQREEHGYKLAKYDNAPDFTVGFRYYEIGEGNSMEPDRGRDAWMIPVKVSIPLWRGRINSTVSEARSMLQASESKLEWAKRSMEFELKSAYLKYISQQKVVDLYKNGLVPQAELAFSSTQAGYEAGGVGIEDFIESEREYLNTQKMYYEALSEAAKSLVMIENIVGKDITSEVNKEGVEHESL